MTETSLTPNPFVVQILEDFHNPEFFKTNHIKMILGQWAYDANKVVHCCEITGSYELNFIRYEVVYEDDFEASDEHKERVDDEVRLASEPFQYIHCSSIDKVTLVDSKSFTLSDKPWRMEWMSVEEVEALDPDEDHIEGAVEYFQANHF